MPATAYDGPRAEIPREAWRFEEPDNRLSALPPSRRPDPMPRAFAPPVRRVLTFLAVAACGVAGAQPAPVD